MKNFSSLSLLALLLFLFSSNVSAQKKLYLCSDYTANGDPTGTASSWVIKPTGGNVYFLYKNDYANISTPLIYIYLDKMTNGVYTAYKTEKVTPDKYKSWLVYDNKFAEAGEYKISVMDASKNLLAAEYCTIKLNDEPSGYISSDYYDGSSVVLCEDVTADGQPITKSDVFNIGTNGGYVYILVNTPQPMKTKKLIVDIWKGEGYNDFVETKELTVEENWVWMKYKYTFYTAGNYKIMVYNSDSKFINSGYVTINRK